MELLEAESLDGQLEQLRQAIRDCIGVLYRQSPGLRWVSRRMCAMLRWLNERVS